MNTHYLWALAPLVPAALVVACGYAMIVLLKLKKPKKEDDPPKPKYGFIFKGGSKFEDDACLACYPVKGAERIAPHAKDCCALYDPEQHDRAELELLAAAEGMLAWAFYRQGMAEQANATRRSFQNMVTDLETLLIQQSQKDLAGNPVITEDNVHIFVEYGLRRAYEELTGSSTL